MNGVNVSEATSKKLIGTEDGVASRNARHSTQNSWAEGALREAKKEPPNFKHGKRGKYREE